MNIGFDAKRAFLNQTGLGNYARFVIQGLFDFFPQDAYSLYSPNLSTTQSPFVVSSSQQVKQVTLGNGWQGSVSRVIGMKRFFDHDSLDIFHGLSNELPFFSRHRKTKQIVSIHDLLFLRYPQFYPLLDRTIYKAKTVSACRNADLVIAISEQTKQDLVDYLHVPNTKIKVHYQSCHPQFRKEYSEQEVMLAKRKYGLSKPYVLQVGTLENRKNALLTIKAFAQSRFRYDLDLVLVGKRTNYCDILYQFVEENHLQNSVHFVHRSDFQDFPLLYKGAFLSVYPSLFEGFGIPVLESMTMGIPVITSKGGCFHEVGGNAALYVDPYSAQELTALMEQVVYDSATRRETIARGNERAKEFAVQKLITELHNLYKGIA